METDIAKIDISEFEKRCLLDLLIAASYYITEKGRVGNPFVKKLGNKDEEEAFKIMQVAVRELAPVMGKVLTLLTEEENDEITTEQPVQTQ